MLKIGTVSRTYGDKSADDTARLMKEAGFVSTELCFTFAEADYWSYNGSRPLDGLTDGLVEKIVKKFRDAGIYIASIGCFSNMFDPDPERQKSHFAFFERHFELAREFGIPAVATEAGFIPGRRGINADTYEKDFSYFRSNVMTVLGMAEKYGVDLALEACILDLTPSAKRTRDFIVSCGSPRFKVLLDPANMIPNSSEEDMFFYLAPYISYIHGKDRKVDDAYGRALGDGDIDWPKFFSLYHKYAADRPFMLEYVTPDNCAAIKRRAEEFDAASL